MTASTGLIAEMWGTEFFVWLFLLIVVGWPIISIVPSAVAVAIVGPRRLSAVISPAAGTFVCWPLMIGLDAAQEAKWVTILVVVPLAFALVQRLVLYRGGEDRVPVSRWVIGCLLVGSGIGLAVALVVSQTLRNNNAYGALIVLIGLIPAMVVGWSRTEAASGNRGAMSLPPT